jgi:DNA-binding response OmpR family regulator
MRVFTTFMSNKYATKPTDPEAVQAIIQTIHTSIPTEAHDDLENLITMDELQVAVKANHGKLQG